MVKLRSEARYDICVEERRLKKERKKSYQTAMI